MKDEKAVDEQQQKPQKREELVEEILQSLGSVVDRISSDDAVDGIQNLPKFYEIIQDLSQRAPKTAGVIATTIQKKSADLAIAATAKGKGKEKEEVVGATSTALSAAKRKGGPDPDGDGASSSTRPSKRNKAQTLGATTVGSRPAAASMASTAQNLARGSTGEGSSRPSQPGRHANIPQATPAGPQLSRPVMELVVEAVEAIYLLSTYQTEVKRDVYQRILYQFQRKHQAAREKLGLTSQWTDGRATMQLLDMGERQRRKATILNMLEDMDAWDWFRKGLVGEGEKTTTTTTTTASRHGKNKMEDAPPPQSRWIAGAGLVSLEDLDNDKDNENGDGDGATLSITEVQRLRQRKYLITRIRRGRNLVEHLLPRLGPGMLFSARIVEYADMNQEQLHGLVGEITVDKNHMVLLRILGQQLLKMIDTGRPSLLALYNAIVDKKLLTDEQVSQLNRVFHVEARPIPEADLDNALNSLITDVNKTVMGYPSGVGPAGDVTLNKSVFMSDVFGRLASRRWMNDDLIMAAMDISDKPFYVRHGYSVALHEGGANNNTLTERVRPFAAWARGIKRLREEAQREFGKIIPLVYFCPVNHTRDHWSLLEINERDRRIRHYDSGPPVGNSKGQPHERPENRMHQLMKEEFSHLNAEYEEVETPRQHDTWSCGPRTVHTFRRVANGLPIPLGRDTKSSVDVMTMELIEAFRAAVKDGALKRKTPATATAAGDGGGGGGDGDRDSDDDLQIIEPAAPAPAAAGAGAGAGAAPQGPNPI